MKYLSIMLIMLVFIYIILFSVYLFMGIDRIEETIGVGYTKKHLKLWFGISLVEAVIIGWMYLAYFG